MESERRRIGEVLRSIRLAAQFGKPPNQDAFELESGFTLGSASNGINPPAEPVILQIGTFATTIPPGSFTKIPGAFGMFTFAGVIDGVTLHMLIIYPTGTKRYALVAAAQNANLTGTVNPVTVRVSIGVASGTAPGHGPGYSRGGCSIERGSLGPLAQPNAPSGQSFTSIAT
jgi:hypothetical protein